MSEFQKGLVIGMLIIIGCGTFIASSSNDDVGRYVRSGIYLLDTKTGDYYVASSDDDYWNLSKIINPNRRIP